MQNTGMEGSNPGAAAGLAEAADRGNAALARISDTAQQTIERLRKTAAVAADRLNERSQELWELQGRAMQTARDYTKAHPLQTIAVVLAIGVLLSRLLSRK